MTEEEKKKMLAAFHSDPKPAEAEEEYEDPWTDEDLIAISKKIMERLEKNDRNRTEK